MKSIVRLSLLVALVAFQAQASHLNEEEVLAMEKACDDARQQKLAPERAALIEQCTREGESDQAGCTELYGNYGNYQGGAIRRMGKYNELPECQEAYKARKHFHINPGY